MATQGPLPNMAKLPTHMVAVDMFVVATATFRLHIASATLTTGRGLLAEFSGELLGSQCR